MASAAFFLGCRGWGGHPRAEKVLQGPSWSRSHSAALQVQPGRGQGQFALATGVATLNEAVLPSLLQDAELTVPDKRKRVEGVLKKVQKVSKEYGEDIMEHMNSILIGHSSKLVAADT